MLINLFQSFSSLCCSMLLINFSFSSDNFSSSLSELINLIKQSYQSEQSHQSHQSDLKYHNNSNTSILFTYINITKKVSHNSELSESHISMMNNNNNNNNN